MPRWRAAWRATVPGITVNDVCLASLSAVALAASMIREGEATCAVVGGFDSMTGAPHAVHVRGAAAMGDQPMIDVMVHDGLYCSIQDAGMIELSDAENARLDISRADQDAFAAQSHARAAAATEAGRLAEEIAPVDGLALDRDEGIRPDHDAGGARRAAPGRGATARSPRATPRSSPTAAPPAWSPRRAAPAPRGSSRWPRSSAARSSPGPDSTLHLRPAEAAERLLARHGLSAADVDLWEINEAFAGVALAAIRALGVDPARVNADGGAVALGHPLAASGFRLLLTLAHQMRRSGATLGVATMCGGGGQGEACCVRRG